MRDGCEGKGRDVRMSSHTFEDALTGSSVTCDYPGMNALMVRSEGAPEACSSLFFPGCSFLNYGLPLVQAVYDLLREAGEVDGVSLLCCGKILSYEPDGAQVRANFESQLRDRVAACSVERIVTACPNCTKALRDAFAGDERTASIEVTPLPVILADLGYRIDAETAAAMVVAEMPDAAEADGAARGSVALCPHDSCPDRDAGEFAEGLRALLPADMTVEAEHNRKKSFCCGSLVRAMGKFEAADKQARRHGEEAVTAGAAALVTACVSCTYQLSVAQSQVPVYHYLELLYNWRINWHYVDAYMKLRFLFDEALGVTEQKASSRAFVGLDVSEKEES